MQAESPSKPRQPASNERAAESKNLLGGGFEKKLKANKQTQKYSHSLMYERAARASLKRQRGEAVQPLPYISQPMLTLSRELAPPCLLHVQQCSSLTQAELC